MRKTESKILWSYGYKKCVLQAPGNAGNFRCHFTDVNVRQNIEAVMNKQSSHLSDLWGLNLELGAEMIWMKKGR